MSALTAVLLGLAALVSVVAAAPALAASVQLMPAGGQFVSVPITTVLDTRSGLGEQNGVAAKVASGATIAVQVTGSDGVATGATAVVAYVNAVNASASGYLTAYNGDSSDPHVWGSNGYVWNHPKVMYSY